MADGQVNKLMSPEEVTTAVMAWEGGDVRDILVMLGLDAPPKKLRLIVSMDVEPGLDVSVDAIAVAVRRALGHGVGNIRVSRAREV